MEGAVERGFAIEEAEDGHRVVDGRGTVWAEFGAGNPHAAFLAGFFLSLVREAYAEGTSDAAAGGTRPLGVHRGRDPDGSRTWDVRVGGPDGPCLARDGRHPLAPRPTRRARLMLAVARCAYDVAGLDVAGPPPDGDPAPA